MEFDMQNFENLGTVDIIPQDRSVSADKQAPMVNPVYILYLRYFREV